MILSIIIPAYNCKYSISKCLNSILDERYIDDYEIIIVNDGSEDGTRQICENYQNKYSNIHLINKENGGVSSARNAGLDVAIGKYITFIDSDDYTESNFIEYVISKLDKKYELILFNNDIIDKTGNILNVDNCYDSANYDFIFKQILSQKLNQPWGKIFNSGIIKKYNLRFNTKISLGEDLEFLLRYYVNINSVVYWNDVLYHYVYTEGSLSNKMLSDSEINDYCLAYKCESGTLKNLNEKKYKYILMESYVRVLFHKIFISKKWLYNIKAFRDNYNSSLLINEIFNERYSLKTNIKKNILKLFI